MEMENDICFSKQPIKQCPMGTYPTGWGYENEEEENTEEKQMNEQQKQQQLNNQHFTTKNIHFICMARSDSEARHLLHQYRQMSGINNQLDLNSYKQHSSIVEQIQEPKACRRLN